MQNIPWPNIPEGLVEELGRKLSPFKKNYKKEDFDYLDTPEASPIFSTQAEMILTFRAKSILDVGCRTGVINKFLSNYDYEYLGFDSSVDSIEHAKLLYPKKNFVVGDWDDIEKINGSFDCIIFSGALIYKGANHRDFFTKYCNKFKPKFVVIQEPHETQRYHDDRIEYFSIYNDLDFYRENFKFIEQEVDCEIFCGHRTIIGLTLNEN